MKRLTPGCRIVRADGRHMEIRAVAQVGEMRVIRWCEVGHLERTFLADLSPNPAHSNEIIPTANGHSA